jgi:MoxR-like ATPase
MFNIFVDYPKAEEEAEIYRFTTLTTPVKLHPLFKAEDLGRVKEVVERVVVSDYVLEYVTHLVRATRPGDPRAPKFVRDLVDWGAGPRAGQYLIKGAKALAAMDGRPNVCCEDIRRVAIPVLRHRIGTNFQAESTGVDAVKLVLMLLKEIVEPELRLH